MGHQRRLCRPFNIAVLGILLLFLLYNTASYDGSSGLHVAADEKLSEMPLESVSKALNISVDAEEEGTPPGNAPQVDLRIAILTFITRETSYTHLSLKNHQEYANVHNYSLTVDFDAPSPQGLMWHKFDMLERTIAAGTADWMWWVDFDTLITNTTVKIGDIVRESLAETDKGHREGVDLIVSKDCGLINAGSMLLRSSPSSLRFLARVRAYGLANRKLSEQDCIHDVVAASENGERNSTLFVPQRKINSYPPEIGCYDDERMPWQKGDFVVHFAGAWAYLRDDKDSTGTLMRKYVGEVL